MHKFQVLEFEDSNPPPSSFTPYKCLLLALLAGILNKSINIQFFLHGEASRTCISFRCWSLKTQILPLPCLLPPLPFKNASFWNFWPKNQTKVLTSKFFLHGEASRTYISFKCWSLKTQILLLPPLPLKNASFWHFWPEKHLLTNTQFYLSTEKQYEHLHRSPPSFIYSSFLPASFEYIHAKTSDL